MVEATRTNEIPFIYILNQNTHTYRMLYAGDIMINKTEMDLAYMAFTIYCQFIIS